MALILGIDRFMSMLRATINMLGNGVATLVVARWERELDGPSLRRALSRSHAEEVAPQAGLAQRA
jgi:aerobic C4-dicarboxylate transport protein